MNHPADPGGATNFGISQRSYPDIDIANLTVADAVEIYRKDYWLAYRCDELPAALAAFMCDSFIQHRPAAAAKLFQNAIGVTADGVIGSKTIAAARAADLDKLLPELVTLRTDFYSTLGATGRRAAFRLGWFRRMAKLMHFIYTHLPTTAKAKQ